MSTAAVDRPGSMRAYADTLMAAMERYAPDVELELVELDPRPASGSWLRRWQTLALPLRARSQRGRAPDAWHVLDGSRAYVTSALGSAPTLVTMHDIIPWLQREGAFPSGPTPGRAAQGLWRRNGDALGRASLVVCVTDSTKQDVASAFSVPERKSLVVHHPLRSTLAVPASAGAPAQREPGRVLHVGNNAFYKNRAGVLRIFSRLPVETGSRLVMAGPAPDADLLALAASLGLGERLEWLVDPSDAALVEQYLRASLMLFPSLYEGFGWPVLEAMAFGLPVVVSDTPALREVAGGAARALPATDEANMAEEARRLLESPEAAFEQGQLGRARAAQFSTEAFAFKMREAYQQSVRSTVA